MEISLAGRKPIVDESGLMRSQKPPSRRGFTAITLRDAVFAQLAQYMAEHGITTKSAAVTHLLANRAPVVIRDPVPWDEIESALLVEFGLIERKRISSLIANLKTALE